MSHIRFHSFASLILALAITFAGVTPAFADSPPNDDFDSPTVIPGLPFIDSMDTSEATVAFDDPTSCTNNGSVWYEFTPATDMIIEANTFGSDFDTVLSAYTGARGALIQVAGACNDDFNGLQSRIVFHATGGTTYYFLIGFCCGFGGNGGGNMKFSVQELSPVPNDDFANATVIPLPLPFNDSQDTAAATIEANEPVPSCAYDTVGRTVWYTFTPTESGSISAGISFSWFTPVMAVYTGSSLDNLTEVGCRPYGGRLTFQAEANTTYYFQVGTLYSDGGLFGFNLEVAPPPVAGMYFYPSDPSSYDNVQFCDGSYDPGEMDFQSFDWDFGDGVAITTTDWCLNHRYSANGDFTVQQTVTTVDGRTASTSQTVQVRTHDVSISRVSAPRSAKVGQTRLVTVSLQNTRYQETVRIELYRSVPEGFEWIATSTQFVPVRPGKRTTQFTFNYTFRPQDAQIGKVTFEAIAMIEDGRDALPADNEAISAPPTIVNR